MSTVATKLAEMRERQDAESRDRNATRRAASHAALCSATLRPISRATMEGGTAGAVPKAERAKAGTRAEAEHKAALAALGCMACRRIYGPHAPGPVELHHLRGGGWGKGDYLTLIPLCVEHHRGDSGVHGLGVKGFPKQYGFDQADLLDDALALLEMA
jgi:hypothetical protein